MIKTLITAAFIMAGSTAMAEMLSPTESERVLANGTVLHIQGGDWKAWMSLVSYKNRVYVCNVVRDGGHINIACINTDE